MKQFLFLSLLFLFFFGRSQAQVVVPEKPVPPEIQIKTPPSPGSSYVLIPGHWIWHRPTRTYNWFSPQLVENPNNWKWIPGYWKKMPRGWKWIMGYWEKPPKRFLFF